MKTEDKEATQESQSAEAQGPGLLFTQYSQCEQFAEKLKLLHYEKEYVKLSSACRPISRHYFVASTNVGEQFFLFTTLCGWLIQRFLDKTFKIPQELDEPNSTISNILNELRRRQVPTEFPPNKLKSGSGQHCIYVLDKLADLALIESGFEWRKVDPVVEENEDIEAEADNAEMKAEQFDTDEEVVAGEDFDEGVLVDLQAPVAAQINDTGQAGAYTTERQLEAILHSDVDSNVWKLEVERLAPQLKVFVKQDTKDWRMHVEQLQTSHSRVSEFFEAAKPHFNTTTMSLGKELERIAIREKHLNNQLEPFLRQYRTTQDRLAEVREQYRESSGGIVERTDVLQRLSEDISLIKGEIEEQGQKNSDGAPIVKIKQAIAKLEADIQTLDVQIGVTEYSLMQIEVKQRNSYLSRPFQTNF